jgi:hypothetical protein
MTRARAEAPEEKPGAEVEGNRARVCLGLARRGAQERTAGRKDREDHRVAGLQEGTDTAAGGRCRGGWPAQTETPLRGAGLVQYMGSRLKQASDTEETNR